MNQINRLDLKSLRRIAWYQKLILLCVLASVMLAGCQAMVLTCECLVPEQAWLISGLALFLVEIVWALFVFLLASKLYGPRAGRVLALLTLIPLIGLIFVLMINWKATRILQAHGIVEHCLARVPAIEDVVAGGLGPYHLTSTARHRCPPGLDASSSLSVAHSILTITSKLASR